MKKDKNYSQLVDFDESNQLKQDLIKGICSLFDAEEPYHQPHVCLNTRLGVKNLNFIKNNPNVKTQISFSPRLDFYCGDLWLNISLFIFHTEWCMGLDGTNVRLTPRQTSYIISRLPGASKKIVLQKVKDWYMKEFFERINKGLKFITEQFALNKVLIEDTHDNRIFDLRIEGKSKNTPYTEQGMVGDELTQRFLFGLTHFASPDPTKTYDQIDQFIIDYCTGY